MMMMMMMMPRVPAAAAAAAAAAAGFPYLELRSRLDLSTYSCHQTRERFLAWWWPTGGPS